MHAIGIFHIPWETFRDYIEEEIASARATREEESKSMEEGTRAEDE